jgi:LacI family transcriptional regulator, repressor for deo operon, udp, cdd, tsx, nupC, and nupG
MTVRLKDIAAYTGVSVKTVSNVVNGNYARVSAKTRMQILEAIEKLNYRPDIAARYMRKAHVGVIALAIPDLANPYFSEVANAITAVAAEHSYTVLLDCTKGKRENELLLVKGLRPHLIDGILLDAQSLTTEDIQQEEIKKHIVLLGERLFGAPYDHVVIDNVAAAHLATSHLLSLGRRRVAAIGVVERWRSEVPVLRLQGFLQALREAGQEMDPALLVPVDLWRRANGAEAMRYLLSLEHPPDAVFCFNDLLALGAMSMLHEAGLHIPGDVAVVGVDDIEDGRYAIPALTTIAPDKEEISRLAVSLLIERIKGTRQQPPERIDVPFHLRVRKSTVCSSS